MSFVEPRVMSSHCRAFLISSLPLPTSISLRLRFHGSIKIARMLASCVIVMRATIEWSPRSRELAKAFLIPVLGFTTRFLELWGQFYAATLLGAVRFVGSLSAARLARIHSRR